MPVPAAVSVAQSPSESLRAWFDQAPRWLAERQLAQASDHALSLGLEIEAVRRSHTSSANRASQALDRFVCALRNARDVLIGPVETDGPAHLAQRASQEAWQEPALALVRNFQMQERAWSAGALAGADFMRGHEVLARDTLAQLARGLGLPPPAQAQAQDLLGTQMAPARLDKGTGLSTESAESAESADSSGSARAVAQRPADPAVA